MSHGAFVAATANDVVFQRTALDLATSNCRVNPATGKSLVGTVVRQDAASTTVRFFVQSSQNTNLIPDGILYTCTFHVGPSTLPGSYSLLSQNATAFSPTGSEIPFVMGTDGQVIVSLVPAACPGDCDGNQIVTVEELIRGVNIALGTRPATDCPDFDANGDGDVSIAELVGAVNAALGGCPS